MYFSGRDNNYARHNETQDWRQHDDRARENRAYDERRNNRDSWRNDEYDEMNRGSDTTSWRANNDDRQSWRNSEEERGSWRNNAGPERQAWRGDYRNDRYRERSRSPTYQRRRRSPDLPSNKLMLTSLPPTVDRDSMNIILSQHGFNPIDVRVIRKNTDAGGTRAFGFIEFSTIDEARKYMRHTNGTLHFDGGFESRLEFARENDPSFGQERKIHASSDWMCAKCQINNFNRRTSCFKCGTSRRESDALEEKGYNYVGSAPCDTLLVRELPTTISEYDIMCAFANYTNIPIQRIHISDSKKYCLVQLRSVEDANYLLTTFNRTVPYIHNCAVIITFSRTSLNKILLTESLSMLKSQAGVTSSQVQQDPINSAAMLAQNAIQMAQLGRAPDPHGRQTISTPLGVFPLFPKPDQRVFQLEPTTGYYLDSNTGFYYDTTTGFYFNNQTQQWCFWTTKFSTYIPCEGHEPEIRRKLQMEEHSLQQQENVAANGETAESSNAEEVVAEEPKKKKKKEKKDPEEPKSAQDIQREMTKWAKRQEKVKMTFKKPDEAGKTSAQLDSSSAVNPWNDEEEDEDSSNARDRLPLSRPPPPTSTNETVVAAAPVFDEKQFLDHQLLACLLCQRQFKSAEVLEKHCQKSDLHKKNVEAKIAEMGAAYAAASTSSQSPPVAQYRDRAKERRQMHGLDPGIDDYSATTSETDLKVDAERRQHVPIDDSNVGSRLLKTMGWNEGKGLGRNEQGIVNPIAAEQRVQGVGLGAAGARANISMRERVQQATLARFNNIRDPGQ